MKTVEVISQDERSIWAQRVKELKQHNTCKKQYFPNNIDEWEKEGNEIVYKYNIKLQELNKERKICKKLIENKNNPNTRRSKRLIVKSLTDDIQIAVNALMELKNIRK